ncbi:hypothetical protein FZEAL_5305 [Fusarium zealandicum]|uniref:Uncharacterized protein n=1 Tax=Fusarium zealandicum TaxID=1053134 RepID=A0A8H4UK52_9HYPO|nr:hypothetical protein FZEAL_5305 [Fusarium zealandicum]
MAQRLGKAEIDGEDDAQLDDQGYIAPYRLYSADPAREQEDVLNDMSGYVWCRCLCGVNSRDVPIVASEPSDLRPKTRGCRMVESLVRIASPSTQGFLEWAGNVGAVQ